MLHDVVYHEGDEPRPVLKRAAVNEMYVPYLDSDPTAYRKNFFDWGEYGAGPLTASLELGCDCLGEIRYLDAAVLNGHGEPRTISNAICLHEEDFSVLWKHVNTRTGEAAVRRARRLVISSFATVANYDYGFYWSFYQDGMIDLEVKLTGILSVSGIEDGSTPAYGRLVSPNRPLITSTTLACGSTWAWTVRLTGFTRYTPRSRRTKCSTRTATLARW